jgi:hypothetical protein
MVEAYSVNIKCSIRVTNRHGVFTDHLGTITEIEYDTTGTPYQIVVGWNNRTRRIVPKFKDGKMLCHGGKGNPKGQMEIWILDAE